MTSSYRPTFLRGLMYYQNISCVNLKGLLGDHSWKFIHDDVLLHILKVRQQQQTILYLKGKPFWPKSKLNSTNSFLCKFERYTQYKCSQQKWNHHIRGKRISQSFSIDPNSCFIWLLWSKKENMQKCHRKMQRHKMTNSFSTRQRTTVRNSVIANLKAFDSKLDQVHLACQSRLWNFWKFLKGGRFFGG